MRVSKEELHLIGSDENWIKEHGEGYRIVYFYPDGKYSVGAYCSTIEEFMIGFCDSYPIMDDGEIPEFVSNEDLLERYLNSMKNISSVAIYQTDGTLVQEMNRNEIKKM